MITGRLPILATLHIDSSDGLILGPGEKGGDGGEGLTRAFEAVGGTLKRLTLLQANGGDHMPVDACYELGVAIGKLWNLRYLKAHLFTDGRDYHAVGRGMAASGGCPQLFHVNLAYTARNLDWIAYEPSLIVPSVRDLSIQGHGTEEEALLLCCGLVQMSPKHRLVKAHLSGPKWEHLGDAVFACKRAILESRGR
jgi:hypothetical protein